MKRLFKIFSIICLGVLCFTCLTGCDKGGQAIDSPIEDFVDYASELKLDMSSSTKKQEVTVKYYIDGDTTHFNVPTSISNDGVLKARYLAIDTPESTGKVEPYGKKASNFTHEKLENAYSIMVESDDSKWNVDSTGSRFLVWVWYKTSETSDYRNLNLEILQNGLAVASNSANNRYGQFCVKAIDQAKKFKLNCHSGAKDGGFFYGDAIELTLKELRINIENYDGKKVAFEGAIYCDCDQSVYVEDYDEETDIYYGISVYYGKTATGDILSQVKVGNVVRVVGTVSAFNGNWQVSGLTYDFLNEANPNNTKKISDGYTAANPVISAEKFNSNVEIIVSVEGEDVKKEFNYANLTLNTSIQMKNLRVVDSYQTSKTESSSYGAFTLTCNCDGQEIIVRTDNFKDGEGNILPSTYFDGKTIDVIGFVDCYDGDYQIKCIEIDNIQIH